jgi:hypothetical protein
VVVDLARLLRKRPTEIKPFSGCLSFTAIFSDLNRLYYKTIALVGPAWKGCSLADISFGVSKNQAGIAG